MSSSAHCDQELAKRQGGEEEKEEKAQRVFLKSKEPSPRRWGKRHSWENEMLFQSMTVRFPQYHIASLKSHQGFCHVTYQDIWYPHRWVQPPNWTISNYHDWGWFHPPIEMAMTCLWFMA